MRQERLSEQLAWVCAGTRVALSVGPRRPLVQCVVAWEQILGELDLPLLYLAERASR